MSSASAPDRPTYWLTRFLVLRLLGVVYLVAFLSLARQVVPLIGEHGLLPASAYLDRLVTHFGAHRSAALATPSLFWLALSDRLLVAGAWVGVALALLVVAGFANALVMRCPRSAAIDRPPTASAAKAAHAASPKVQARPGLDT